MLDTVQRSERVNGLTLNWIEAGEGPLVLLLHGFPDCHATWQHQLPMLVDAGMKVIAPDMRGYNQSDKPKRVADYRVEHLAADARAIVAAAGEDRATLVGHDWGGIVAWYAAAWYPEVFDRLVVINAPHPEAFRLAMRDPRQLLRSWYMLLFQLPWLPERLLTLGNGLALERFLRDELLDPASADADYLALCRKAFCQPGAARAAINYYRAACRRFFSRAAPCPTLEQPTLLLWGETDPHLGLPLTRGLERWVPAIQVRRWQTGGHWLHIDHPEELGRELVEFSLGNNDPGACS